MDTANNIPALGASSAQPSDVREGVCELLNECRTVISSKTLNAFGPMRRGDFREAAERRVSGRPLIVENVEIPVWWLWHAERLLPAIVREAARIVGHEDIAAGGFVWPQAPGGPSYLGAQRAVADELYDHLSLALQSLEDADGMVSATAITRRLAAWCEKNFQGELHADTALRHLRTTTYMASSTDFWSVGNAA